MIDIEHAIAAALRIHKGQKDKAGAPYILHLLRVMLAVETLEERILAVLHDAVEDTSWHTVEVELVDVPDWLREGLDAISRRSGEAYEDFIARVALNPLARRVKLADLADNMDLSRIPAPTDVDHQRVEKYRRAQAQLWLSLYAGSNSTP